VRPLQDGGVAGFRRPLLLGIEEREHNTPRYIFLSIAEKVVEEGSQLLTSNSAFVPGVT
jgi:hypothetical protein